ncbi:MAG TPA: hypothetical protein VFV67_14680 [Actinophytocola sp.]|uniref:hypothetical protein n=1 Tax=Actinophytocola sp. TaxID=1872138 RepID=UPI002DBEBD0B|nr:hypothetical protein [Actinophytocola sp.]HEU5471894.1 hypothetical protein [Actinophytocola sp.]
MTESGPLQTVGEHRLRMTELEALANVRTVLELRAAGGLRCSGKTSRPSAATLRTAAEHLADGTVSALAQPQGDRRIQPDRADQGPTRRQRAQRGQTPPPGGRRHPDRTTVW